MARIAFMTFGVLQEPWGAERVRGFEDRLDATFAAAEASPGFIAMDDSELDPALPADEQASGPWGVFRRPSLYPYEGEDPALDRDASTLSVWKDIESVFAFAYSGRHLEALQRRADWFELRRWPTYVAWWVGDDEIPTWAEACARLERLHAGGPGPSAFDFHHPFDASGKPVTRPAMTRS